MRTISVRNPLSFLTGRTTRLDGTSPTVARHRLPAGPTYINAMPYLRRYRCSSPPRDRQVSRGRFLEWRLRTVCGAWTWRDSVSWTTLWNLGFFIFYVIIVFLIIWILKKKLIKNIIWCWSRLLIWNTFLPPAKQKCVQFSTLSLFFCNLTEYFRFDCFVRLVAHISNRSANIYGTCCASLAGALAWSA